MLLSFLSTLVSTIFRRAAAESRQRLLSTTLKHCSSSFVLSLAYLLFNFYKHLISSKLEHNIMQSARPIAFRFQLTNRLFSSVPHLHAAPPFALGPAPPRLPKEDQELYEQLQRSSTGAFSTPKPTVVINQTTAASDAHKPSRPQINQSPRTEPAAESPTGQKIENINAKVEARGNGEELHPDVRRGVLPEFEGERNPKTGETGGPKNEPLRWGGGVDWSYNGRVTDF